MLWLEVMSLKSFDHGDLEGELSFREREREREERERERERESSKGSKG